MKSNRRNVRILIVILIAAAALAGGSIYLVFAAVSARRSSSQRIDDLLAEADYEISLGYYQKALESLDSALEPGRGKYNSLRILKRVYRIAYELNDFSILYGYARRAAQDIPGSEELEQIYLYAAIRSNAEGGRSALQRIETNGAAAAYLQAEAYYAGLSSTAPDAEEDPRLAGIVSIAGKPDPQRLQRLGAELDEPRLHLDAAALWMSEGEAQSAFAVVSRHLGDPLFREPGIYISYDAGHDQTALSLIGELRGRGGIEERPDLQIMEADLRLELGEAAEAARLYRQVITTHPGYSWIPYLNLAEIAETNRDMPTAHGYRERAYGRFPGSGAVATAYARSLVDIGDHRGAEEALQRYLEGHEEDYQARLLLLDVQNTASSPALYQAALWMLYNQHPESRMLCEHLFLYLLGFNDLSAADSVLRHYQSATGSSSEPWLLDYRSVLAAVQRDDGEAVRLLRDRLEREDNWQGRYNLAVLLARTAGPDQAIAQLIEAENLMLAERLPAERNSSYRSRIRSHIGEQYLHLGDAAAARRECEYAIDLDVSNFHAHRILRILERE